jgi:hypothetical protein
MAYLPDSLNDTQKNRDEQNPVLVFKSVGIRCCGVVFARSPFIVKTNYDRTSL